MYSVLLAFDWFIVRNLCFPRSLMQAEQNRQYSWQADPMASEGLELFGIEVY